jgi:primosomal protein N' (replication factor Y)
MSESHELFDVALNVPSGDGLFTYRIPTALGTAEPGRRVLVPLGRRTATGVVLGRSQPQAAVGRGPEAASAGDTAPAPAHVRDALRLLDEEPLLTADVVALARWAAAHYVAPLGPALKAALPPGIDVRDAAVPHLTDAGKALLEEGQLDLPGQEGELRRALRKAASGVKLSKARAQSLARRGLVVLVREEERARVAAPLVDVVQAVPLAANALATLRRAPKQREVLEWLLARAQAVPVEELLLAFPRARPHLRALAQRKLAVLSKVPAGASPLPDAPWGAQDHRATPAQASALEALRRAVDARSFSPFLLHGVTGSGKTWVYLEAIAHARAQALGALVLVPEIALTPQLAGRFRARFGDDVAVLHSGLTERERLNEWTRVRDGRAGIVVGARSAVWAPVNDLGIAVVDEEHEPSYKQDERLRYNARDLVLVRAQTAQAVAVLGSATPSLETLRRAQEGKLTTLRLPERVDARALPAMSVVKRSPGEVFTPELAAGLRETLARGEQTILYLNRRGHTRTLLCTSCSSIVGCPNCSVALVLHVTGRSELRCHLCGHAEPPRETCPECGARKLFSLGTGTEKVEEELRAIVPGARIERLDRDAAGGPGQAAAVLARFARREVDVLVGTQMVAKGHDFPGVTLVGILDADGPLQLPDFRAAERCIQLLVQVAGRAGRGSAPGKVIAQAFKPALINSNYDAFAAEELKRREELRFPPFVRLAAVRLQGNDEGRVKGAAERVANSARRLAGSAAEVLGPSPAPLARLRGKHRWQLLLRAATHPPLQRLARALGEAVLPSGVELSVDIDPSALL